jgi:hypothetical protein
MNDKQRDSAVAIGVFITSVALRVPFRSALPYHWDCAEFALAINDYNIALSQPHAPGYFLYVMLGRVVNFFLGDPHASLVWLNVVTGSLLVPVMYWLGTAMFDRRTGMIAALLVMTSPQTWFHSEVALTYIVDALLVCFVVSLCWRAIQRGGTWGDVVLIGASLAVVGGVRQQSVPALTPVLAYTFWRFTGRRVTKLLVAAATALLLGLIWFWPMVAMTGWDVYFEIVRRHTAFNAPATWMGGGLDALVWNIFFAALFSLNGLMLAALALPAAMKLRTEAQRLAVIWGVGVFVMGTFVGFTKQPGYVLNFLPGLLLLAASALARWRWPVAAVVCAFNVFAFVAWPAAWDGVFHGTARTAREIRERDRRLRETVAAVRQECDPAVTVVCHAGEYLHFGLKQFQLLLPEFDQYQLQLDPTMLTPPGQPMMAARDGKLRFVSGVDWTGKRMVVLIVPPDRGPDVFAAYLDVSTARDRGVFYVIEVDRVHE